MEYLWVLSKTKEFLLVPHSESVVDEEGILKRKMMKYSFGIKDAEEFSSLCNRVDCIIFVASESEFGAEYIQFIPSDLPCLALMCEGVNPAVHRQLGSLPQVEFVFSPFTRASVSNGIKKLIDDRSALDALRSELKNYTDIAFTAMSSASEMGVVAFYAQAVQSISSFEVLAEQTLRCLKDLSVQGFIQFAFDDNVEIYPACATSTYRDLLNWTRTSSHRIVSVGRFLVFNFENVQLVITDAPFENSDKYGRLRDIISHIASIAEARAKTIKVNGLLKSQQENTAMVMMLLEMATRDNRNSVKTIMMDLSMSLREMAMGLDLTLEQETAMLRLSEKALQSLESLHEATDAVEIHFRSLLLQLDQAAKLLRTSETSQSAGAETSVELF